MGFVDWMRGLFSSKPVVCEPPNDPYALGFSVFIVFGMFLSYLPQHVKIIQKGSSDGLSPWYQLLGALATSSLLQNTIILQFPLFACCAIFTPGKCMESLLGIAQIAAQAICFFFMFFLFVYYFPEDRRYVISLMGMARRRSREYERAITITKIVILYMLVTIVVSGLLLHFYGSAQDSIVTEAWADGLGLLSLVVSTAQFIPQIVHTWKANKVGAVSILSMLMQTPGSFILVYTLAVRPGNNVTTWITYVFTGTLQFALLCMCVYYTIRDNNLRAKGLPVPSEEEHQYGEDEPLLDDNTLGEKSANSAEEFVGID